MKNWVLISLVMICCYHFTAAQENELKKSTATSNVHLLSDTFSVDGLDAISHRVWVYLPPDYDTTKKRYPVIYMHDGQNLFDNITSYLGEWGVDESLNAHFEKTGQGFIVVGVDNSGAKRINEYTPWKHEKHGGGDGQLYMEFLVKKLKPYIDKNFRTKRGYKHTSLIGSSLGGLISYYGGLKYPKVFGNIGALSTSFWFSNKVFEFSRKHGKQQQLNLYLLVGGKEGPDMVKGTQIIEKLLLETGFNNKRIYSKIVLDGAHNEIFWKQEFLAVVQWLYQNK